MRKKFKAIRYKRGRPKGGRKVFSQELVNALPDETTPPALAKILDVELARVWRWSKEQGLVMRQMAGTNRWTVKRVDVIAFLQRTGRIEGYENVR